MKDLLLILAGVFHPPLVGRLRLSQLLLADGVYCIHYQSSFEQLPKGPVLSEYAAVIVYVHHKRISSEALQAFGDYVRGGGGVLAIHSATASFKEEPGYAEILGGRFTGHGRVERFDVTPVAAAGTDDPFAGCAGFTVRDELYLHDLQPGVRVHFEARGSGQAAPAVWTYRYSAGRVCYCVPGHRAATMANPAYQQVLLAGLRWAAGGGQNG